MYYSVFGNSKIIEFSKNNYVNYYQSIPHCNVFDVFN